MENRSSLKILAVIVLLVVSNYISWNIGKSASASAPGNAPRAETLSPGTIPGGLRGFGGTIESVSDSGFTLRPSTYDQVASKGPSIRNVSVNKDTVIERLIQKDSATIAKEQSAFAEKIAAKDGSNSSSAIVPPEPFTRERISLQDIKEGDMVLVYADEDITNAKQFTAARVSLQPSVNLPGAQTSPAAPAVTSD